MDVEEQQARGDFLQSIEGGLAVTDRHDFVTHRMESVAQYGRDIGVVFHHQHEGTHHGTSAFLERAGGLTGRRMKKVVPAPSLLSTVIWPPCAFTTSLTIFVPRPVPPGFRLRARAVNRLSRISGGIPPPVSSTERKTALASRSVWPRTVIEPPGGTSGIALLTRL